MSLFDMTVDPQLQPRCSSQDMVKQYLATHSLGPPNTAGEVPQRMVVTLLAVEDSSVTWSTLAVINNGPKNRFVFISELYLISLACIFSPQDRF